MEFEKTSFKDLIICTPKVFLDKRGYFYESFKANEFESFTGFDPKCVQENQSKSQKNVLRGLHFQIGTHAQSKLVRVLQGRVLDVVVDLRKDEPTFGKHFTIELSESNKKQLYVPRGMAHGFVTLSDNATFLYKCDNYYDANSERGLQYNDPELSIDWGIKEENAILSDKDLLNSSFKDLPQECLF